MTQIIVVILQQKCYGKMSFAVVVPTLATPIYCCLLSILYQKKPFFRWALNPSDGCKLLPLGSGCGAVGRAVAYNTRGPGFESSHWQLLLNIYLLLTVCRKDENKEKRSGMAHFKKNRYASYQVRL